MRTSNKKSRGTVIIYDSPLFITYQKSFIGNSITSISNASIYPASDAIKKIFSININ